MLYEAEENRSNGQHANHVGNHPAEAAAQRSYTYAEEAKEIAQS